MAKHGPKKKNNKRIHAWWRRGKEARVQQMGFFHRLRLRVSVRKRKQAPINKPENINPVSDEEAWQNSLIDPKPKERETFPYTWKEKAHEIWLSLKRFFSIPGTVRTLLDNKKTFLLQFSPRIVSSALRFKETVIFNLKKKAKHLTSICLCIPQNISNHCRANRSSLQCFLCRFITTTRMKLKYCQKSVERTVKCKMCAIQRFSFHFRERVKLLVSNSILAIRDGSRKTVKWFKFQGFRFKQNCRHFLETLVNLKHVVSARLAQQKNRLEQYSLRFGKFLHKRKCKLLLQAKKTFRLAKRFRKVALLGLRRFVKKTRVILESCKKDAMLAVKCKGSAIQHFYFFFLIWLKFQGFRFKQTCRHFLETLVNLKHVVSARLAQQKNCLEQYSLRFGKFLHKRKCKLLLQAKKTFRLAKRLRKNVLLGLRRFVKKTRVKLKNYQTSAEFAVKGKIIAVRRFSFLFPERFKLLVTSRFLAIRDGSNKTVKWLKFQGFHFNQTCSHFLKTLIDLKNVVSAWLAQQKTHLKQCSSRIEKFLYERKHKLLLKLKKIRCLARGFRKNALLGLRRFGKTTRVILENCKKDAILAVKCKLSAAERFYFLFLNWLKFQGFRFKQTCSHFLETLVNLKHGVSARLVQRKNRLEQYSLRFGKFLHKRKCNFLSQVKKTFRLAKRFRKDVLLGLRRFVKTTRVILKSYPTSAELAVKGKIIAIRRRSFLFLEKFKLLVSSRILAIRDGSNKTVKGLKFQGFRFKQTCSHFLEILVNFKQVVSAWLAKQKNRLEQYSLRYGKCLHKRKCKLLLQVKKTFRLAKRLRKDFLLGLRRFVKTTKVKLKSYQTSAEFTVKGKMIAVLRCSFHFLERFKLSLISKILSIKNGTNKIVKWLKFQEFRFKHNCGHFLKTLINLKQVVSAWLAKQKNCLEQYALRFGKFLHKRKCKLFLHVKKTFRLTKRLRKDALLGLRRFVKTTKVKLKSYQTSAGFAVKGKMIAVRHFSFHFLERFKLLLSSRIISIKDGSNKTVKWLKFQGFRFKQTCSHFLKTLIDLKNVVSAWLVQQKTHLKQCSSHIVKFLYERKHKLLLKLKKTRCLARGFRKDALLGLRRFGKTTRVILENCKKDAMLAVKCKLSAAERFYFLFLNWLKFQGFRIKQTCSHFLETLVNLKHGVSARLAQRKNRLEQYSLRFGKFLHKRKCKFLSQVKKTFRLAKRFRKDVLLGLRRFVKTTRVILKSYPTSAELAVKGKIIATRRSSFLFLEKFKLLVSSRILAIRDGSNKIVKWLKFQGFRFKQTCSHFFEILVNFKQVVSAWLAKQKNRLEQYSLRYRKFLHKRKCKLLLQVKKTFRLAKRLRKDVLLGLRRFVKTTKVKLKSYQTSAEFTVKGKMIAVLRCSFHFLERFKLLLISKILSIKNGTNKTVKWLKFQEFRFKHNCGHFLKTLINLKQVVSAWLAKQKNCLEQYSLRFGKFLHKRKCKLFLHVKKTFRLTKRLRKDALLGLRRFVMTTKVKLKSYQTSAGFAVKGKMIAVRHFSFHFLERFKLLLSSRIISIKDGSNKTVKWLKFQGFRFKQTCSHFLKTLIDLKNVISARLVQQKKFLEQYSLRCTKFLHKRKCKLSLQVKQTFRLAKCFRKDVLLGLHRLNKTTEKKLKSYQKNVSFTVKTKTNAIQRFYFAFLKIIKKSYRTLYRFQKRTICYLRDLRKNTIRAAFFYKCLANRLSFKMSQTFHAIHHLVKTPGTIVKKLSRSIKRKQKNPVIITRELFYHIGLDFKQLVRRCVCKFTKSVYRAWHLPWMMVKKTRRQGKRLVSSIAFLIKKQSKQWIFSLSSETQRIRIWNRLILARYFSHKKEIILTCALLMIFLPMLFIKAMRNGFFSLLTHDASNNILSKNKASLFQDSLLCFNDIPQLSLAYSTAAPAGNFMPNMHAVPRPPDAIASMSPMKNILNALNKGSESSAPSVQIGSAQPLSTLLDDSQKQENAIASQQQSKEWLPQRLFLRNTQETDDGFGQVSNYWTLDVLTAPLFTAGKILPLLDVRWHEFSDDNKANRFAANVGFMARYIPERQCAPLIGANIYYDYRHSSIKKGWNRLGLGLEILGKRWDFRLNGYFPIGSKLHMDKCTFDEFEGGYKMVQRKYELMFTGFNAEIGSNAILTKNWLVYLKADTYYLTAKCHYKTWGFMIGLRPQFKDYVALDLSVSHDHVFKTVYQGQLIFSLPLYSFGENKKKMGPCGITQRQIYQPVERFDIIPVTRVCCWDQNF